MSKKSDDQHGYDPERQAARTLLDHLEQRADKRLDKPARQLGEVLKLPKTPPKTKRLIDGHIEIRDTQPEDISYLHSVLCQTSLPYRPTDLRRWQRRQGAVSLLIEAGSALDPRTGEFVELGLPHGERPRLILIYLSTQAVLNRSPTVEVGDSLTAFARSLGIDTNGPSIRRFKDQLARLAASTVRLGVVTDGRATQINTQIVSGIDLWLPKDADQRILWPSTVTLSAEYYATLQQHAIPLDPRAIAKLAGSALALDVYVWLAQRLYRIEGKPQAITWAALKAQFGPDYDRLRKFREKFVPVLREVQLVYPAARLNVTDTGLVLHNSDPPISKPMSRLVKGTVIDVTSTSSDPVD